MKKFLTSKEAADYLGIRESELEKMVERKELRSYKIGGVYTRFGADDLDICRAKSGKRIRNKDFGSRSDRAKDFLYFNDFYIFSFFAIIVILYFIFR